MNDKIFSKAALAVCICMLAAAVLSSYIPASGEEELYKNVIRLHVIAESDSDEDQALKLCVRDEILSLVSEKMETASGFDDAYSMLKDMIPEIKSAAQRRAAAEGSPVAAEVIFDRESYPVRYYENYAFPAGEYMSMRVVLGEGRGANWWCVLFPPLCRDAAVNSDDGDDDRFFAAGFTPEEYKIIKKESPAKYKVRFKILELLSDAFGFDY